MTGSSLRGAVLDQRERLTALLGEPMYKLARRCARVMDDRVALEALLGDGLTGIARCKHLYVLDAGGVQVTDNITREGRDPAHFGRDRSSRPYLQGIVGTTDFKLSAAYISRNKKRPSLTAVQVIRDGEGGARRLSRRGLRPA